MSEAAAAYAGHSAGIDARELCRPVCFGVSWWNHRAVATLLAQPTWRPPFYDTFGDALERAATITGDLVAWAAKLTPEDEAAAAARGVRVIRIEDGFLRSVGLGAGLTSGGSYVLDGRGIHYDGSRASDLEHLLETADVTPEQRARGLRLVDSIRQARLSKYNVGRRARSSVPGGGILVPGQVAGDAAVAHAQEHLASGAGEANPNLALLKAVRARNPAAVIVYRPHPDVAAGLRPGRIARANALTYANHVAADADIADLLDAAQRVETLSSLTGFEALLRGKPVAVHGLPFYAGWGLTEDLIASPRRTRRRTLDEVVYLTLVAYCRYVDPAARRVRTAEEQVARLAQQRQTRRHVLEQKTRQHLSWLGRRLGL
ncbi:MAG: beta-3-deoxy-D-manno-oct-2-ulosonic acid transferase [Hyphomicrobiaceae bacterium]